MQEKVGIRLKSDELLSSDISNIYDVTAYFRKINLFQPNSSL